MSFVEIILIGGGLAADAFAVSVCVGAGGHARDTRSMIRLAWHFGFFQFMMPVLGWCAGIWIAPWISAFDRWIAFFLLALVGIRMIRSAMYPEEIRVQKNPTKGSMLVLLSFATSIDALTVGFSFAMINARIWYPGIVIGVVTGLASYGGIRLGEKFSRLSGRFAEAIGGLVLLALGVRILILGQ